MKSVASKIIVLSLYSKKKYPALPILTGFSEINIEIHKNLSFFFGAFLK